MSDKESEGINWEGVTEEMARQILHQGETFLQAQLAAGIAADQRAITAASIFVAVATALIGGTLAYWSSVGYDSSLVAAGVASGILMTLAAGGCFWSARPVEFYFPGSQPEQWWGTRNKSLVTAIGGETENYQHMIAANETRLANSAWWFQRSMLTALAAPLLALAVVISS